MPATLIEFIDGQYTYTQIEADSMKNESDEITSDLLRRWHRWTVTNPPALGFPKRNAACSLYRASRQMDDFNGALDSDAEAAIMEAVDHAIDRLPQPYHTAVCFHARNLATGITVWRSPRLPENDIDLAKLVVISLAKLMLLFESDGIAA